MLVSADTGPQQEVTSYMTRLGSLPMGWLLQLATVHLGISHATAG